MKAKTSKTRKSIIKVNKAKFLDPEIKQEAITEEGFEKSKALSPKEIKELKDTLEYLNRQNTSGG